MEGLVKVSSILTAIVELSLTTDVNKHSSKVYLLVCSVR